MRLPAYALIVALVTQSMPALAADPVAAETLFDEGRKLMDAGKLPEACAKFEASHRLDPAVGTLLNLGDCNERRGRFASAWTSYRAAESLALTRKDKERAKYAKQKAEDAQSKLSNLTIQVAQPEPDLKITRDGAAVDEAAWGTAIPIDPGPHVIEATAPGKKTFTLKVTIPETASSQTAKIEPLVADGPAPPPPPHAPPGKDEPVQREPFFTTGRVVGFSAIGAGAIALGVGGVLALSAKSKWNDARTAFCDSANQCDAEGLQINQDARSQGNVATVLIVAGAAVAIAGAACLLFWPKPAPPKPGAPGAPGATSSNALHWHGAGFAF